MDAGYDLAEDAARERGVRIPMREGYVTTRVFTNVGELTTNDPDPRRRVTTWDASTTRRWSLTIGTCLWVGSNDDAPASRRTFDVEGAAVVPGFVDSHTHLVFARRTLRRSLKPAWRVALRRGRHRATPSTRHAAATRRRVARGDRSRARASASKRCHHDRDQVGLRTDDERRSPSLGDSQPVQR